MASSSPAKKRKKNPPSSSSPYKGKTLDHFFAKKPSVPLPSQPAAPASHSEEADASTLTDEEFARRLAWEWGEEDQAMAVNGGLSSHAGSKRQRSSSQERRNSEPASQVAAKESEEDQEGDQQTSTTTPQSKKAVGILVLTEGNSSKTTEAIPLDNDPLTFNPNDYQHLTTEWPHGRTPYSLLTHAFVLVNATRSRIKIVDTLVNLLRLLMVLDPESLLPAVWLTTNDIGPPYENTELGIGSSTIAKAIIKTSGITPAAVKKLYHKYGDPGDVAFSAKSTQRTLAMGQPAPLTITGVYSTLVKLAAVSGKGSQAAKETHVKRLLVAARGEELRYLVRTLLQHLRIGAVRTTMLIALARAFVLRDTNTHPLPTEKEKRLEVFARAEDTLKRCFARRPNYNDLVPALLSGGVDALPRVCGMALHVPLIPMLGSITRDLDEMLVKLRGREFTCEYKYDGQRAQIHCDESGRVEIFSRHLELMTGKYPDLVALVPRVRGEGVKSFILEGEVVAVDANTGELGKFQTLAGRERKNVDIGNVTVTVCLFAFDLMYLNGQELLSTSLRERRELLRTMFTPVPHKFALVQSLDAVYSDSDRVRSFFTAALSSRCEGLMVKVLDNPSVPSTAADTVPSTARPRHKPLLATYTPSQRLESWLKVKADYSRSSDTLDLIPIGGWHGQGRKAAWWSPILLAVRNPSTGALEAVCKCMSGFTDKMYAEITAFYAPDLDGDGGSETGNTSAKRKAYYDAPSAIKPNVWFEPSEVWEIAFAQVSLSPVYTAGQGLVDGERGLSLRFPRFVRRRGDKGIEEASTGEGLAELYWKQERRGGGAGGNTDIVEGIEEEEEEDLAREDSNEPGEEEEEEGDIPVPVDDVLQEDTTNEER